MIDDAEVDCTVPRLDLPNGEIAVEEFERGDFRLASARRMRLAQVVRERIGPRLALIHREWKSDPELAPPTQQDIHDFCEAILAEDPLEAHSFFQRMRDRGLTADVLFETLLSPAARHFGELWEEDFCDFVDVAVGVNRLRVLLEVYANAPAPMGEARQRAFLVSTPRDQHIFGLDVVASFLRASGWDVRVEYSRTAREVAEIVAANWYAIIGVTVSEEDYLDDAAQVIEAARKVSFNPSVMVMAGGNTLRGRADLVARLGADATAEDGPGAALLAQKLLLTMNPPGE